MDEAQKPGDVQVGPRTFEAVLEGGLKSVIKYLQRDIPKHSIRSVLSRVEAEGEAFFLSQEFRQKATVLKGNTLIAYAINEIWPQVTAWQKKHPGQIGQYTTGNLQMHEAKDDRFDALFNAGKADEGFAHIRTYVTHMMSHLLSQWYADVAKAKRPVAIALASYATEEMEPRATPTMLIDTGFTTAADTVQGMVNGARVQYEHQFGKQLTRKAYAELMPSIKQLAQVVATQSAYSLSESFHPTAVGDYEQFVKKVQMRGIRITEDPLSVDFTPEMLHEFADRHARMLDSLAKKGLALDRTGCPALFVKGASGQNIIAEFFDFVTQILDRYYAPALSR